jgi:hypothetical protein
MRSVLLHIRTAWNDYFTGNSTSLSKTLYTSRQTFSDSSIYVSSCLFRSIETTGVNGGALCCTSVTYLLIESSSFFSCKTSSYSGGAIYFSNSGGQCVLYKVCGYDCSTTSSADSQFARISVNSVISSKNYFIYSSIARCVNEASGPCDPISLIFGTISCPSVNSSMNKCGYRSGIFCRPSVYSNSVTCSLIYSTFADNTATSNICIYFNMEGAEYEMKSCNVIRNTQVSLDLNGVILVVGKTMIQDSCILENKANRIFHSYSSYTITISNCTVDKTSNNGFLTTRNTVAKSFILALNHMSTRNCHSKYDSVGTLTPITPHYSPPSSSKKQIHCYTREKFFYQLPPQTFFVSLYASV